MNKVFEIPNNWPADLRPELEFFLELLQVSQESGDQREPVWQYLKENLEYLNLDLIPVMEQWVDRFIAENPDDALDFVELLENLIITIERLEEGSQPQVYQEISIASYKLILKVRTLERTPELWAATQYNLGLTYRNLADISENPQSALEKAIDCYEASLRVYTETQFPQDWADIQFKLGLTYSDLADCEENPTLILQKTINNYQAALRIYTESNFPQSWAACQHNLGLAYRHLANFEDNPKNIFEQAIEYYKASLRVYTETNLPEDWANTQRNLGLAYWNLADFEENPTFVLEKAIECYQAALRVYTETEFPQDWVNIKFKLGLTYSDLADCEENPTLILQETINNYQAALRIYTESNFPQNWAECQYNLGLTYRHLADISENLQSALEKAIDCYEASLRVYTETQFPQDWADIKFKLGLTYSDLAGCEENPTLILQETINNYQAALRIYTESNFPQNWAECQYNLGLTYRHLANLSKDPKNIFEKAIACYQDSLRIYTEMNFPEDWADTQFKLGITYSDLATVTENPRNVLEKSIECYEKSLQFYTEVNYPEDWADTQNNIGRVYSTLFPFVENPKPSLEKAIACYQQALNIRTEADFPQDWAMIQSNLGYTCSELATFVENPKATFEQAIECYQSTLRVYTETEFPENWANLQNFIGLTYTYLFLYTYDPETILKQAIDHYELALRIRTENQFPEAWADTQNNLGLAYTYLSLDTDDPEPLEKAIDYYQAGLRVRTELKSPHSWAMTQNNLGVAYLYLASLRENPRISLEQARNRYQMALQVYTEAEIPQHWAMVQSNLGYTCSKLATFVENPHSMLEQAIKFNQAALRVYTEVEAPQGWARTQTILGNIYSELATFVENPESILQKAIICYQSALRIRTPIMRPVECLGTADPLGNLGFNQGNWELALEGYETTIAAVEQIRTWAIDDQQRQEILEEFIEVYGKAIQCYINLGQYDQAMLLTERARSRHLVDLMATADLYDNATLPPELADYLEQYEDLQEQIDRLREPPQNPDTLLIHSEALQTLRTVKNNDEKIQDIQDRKMDLWEQIRRIDPVLAGEKEVTPLSWDDLTHLIADLPTTALVSFYTTNEHTHILILSKPEEKTVPHICTLHTCTDQSYETLQNWIYEQWLEPYQKAKYSKKTFLDWQDNMERLLQELADRLDLSTLIDQHLQGIEELIIIPHIFLHLIPFAALPIHKTHEQEARYLGDRFRLRILPSANILKYCHDRQNSPTAPIVSFNAYGSVEGAGDPSKDYAMTIARTLFDPVAQGLEIPGNQRLLDLQATSDRYHDLIKSEQVQAIHSIHHASAQLDDPLNSALHLADGDITLAQLMSYRWRMPQMQDIFLAACETNLGNPSISDDILTLGAGFLCAGARSVVSTLWSVDAIATTVFCEFYYYERQLGHDRPTALHNAQVQLRDQTITELNRSLAVQAYLKLLRQEILGIEKTIAPLEAQEKDLYEDFKSRSKPRPTQHPYRDLSDLRTQLSQKQKDLEKWKSGSDRPFESPYFWSAFILQGLR